MAGSHSSSTNFALAGRYEPLEHLGAGGMGRVFSAYDQQLEIEVAVKSVGVVHGDNLLRFKREFRSVQDLVHPNLIGLGELFEVGGHWYYTMERIRGSSFLDYVRPRSETADGESVDAGFDTQIAPAMEDATEEMMISGTRAGARVGGTWAQGELDEGRLRHAMVQLADALRALHRAGQIHRDLKPGNVLVTEAGRVVVLDFGLTSQVGSVDPNEEDKVLGTPAYMAPEQLRSVEVGAPSDWYAVGVMLYQALTGGVPFKGTAAAVLEAKNRIDPAAPSELGVDAPPDLESLCMDLLRRDPHARPAGDEVLQRLDEVVPVERRWDRDTTHAHAEPSLFQPFLGRHVERAAVLRAYEAVRRKQAARILVTGPSGIGKSALIRDTLRRIEERSQARPVVLRGRCYERERVAYNALDEWIDTLSGYLLRELGSEQRRAIVPQGPEAAALLRAFPVLRRVPELQAEAEAFEDALPRDPSERQERLYAGLRALFAGFGRRRHVVVALEDLQWADEDSFAVLAALVQPPSPPPVLLLMSARNALFERELNAAAKSFLSSEGMERIDLAPLTPADGVALAEALGADMEAAESLAKAAGGHPLFLELLVQQGRKESRAARPEEGALFSLLQEALYGEVQRQTPEARALVMACAVAGKPTSLVALRKVTGIEGTALQQSLRALRGAKLVRVDGSLATTDRHGDAGPRVTAETYHDQVRDAVLAHLSEEHEVALHGALVDALQDEGAAPDELLRHCLAAGRADEARTWAELAGDLARQAMAFERAASFYETALEGIDEGSASWLSLASRRAECLANAGRLEEGARLLHRTLPHLDDEQVLPVKQQAAVYLLRAGHFEEGKKAMGSVMKDLGLSFPESSGGAVMRLLWVRLPLTLRSLEKIEPRSPSEVMLDQRDRLRLECCSVGSNIFSVTDPFLGGYFASRYLSLAVAARDRAHLAVALANEAVTSAYLGNDDKGDELIERARELSRGVDDPYPTGFVAYCEAALAMVRLDDMDLIRDAGAHASGMLRSIPGMGWGDLATVELLVGGALSHRGQYRKLIAHVERQVSRSRTLGDHLGLANFLLEFAVSLRWLVKDQPEAFAAAQEEGMAVGAASSPFHRHHRAMSLSWLQLYRGEYEEAVVDLRRNLASLRKLMALKAPVLEMVGHFHLGRAELALAETLDDGPERRRLHRAASKAIRALRASDKRLCRGWGTYMQGALHFQQGDTSNAVRLLDDAIQIFREAHAGGYEAVGRMHFGSVVGGDDGARYRNEGLRHLLVEGVRRPERFAATLLPGLRTVDRGR